MLAFVVLWIRRRSVLDLWLAVAIFATVVETGNIVLVYFQPVQCGSLCRPHVLGHRFDNSIVRDPLRNCSGLRKSRTHEQNAPA